MEENVIARLRVGIRAVERFLKAPETKLISVIEIIMDGVGAFIALRLWGTHRIRAVPCRRDFRFGDGQRAAAGRRIELSCYPPQLKHPPPGTFSKSVDHRAPGSGFYQGYRPDDSGTSIPWLSERHRVSPWIGPERYRSGPLKNSPRLTGKWRPSGPGSKEPGPWMRRIRISTFWK